MRDLFGESVKFDAYGLFAYVKKGNETSKLDKSTQLFLYALKDNRTFTSQGEKLDPANFFAEFAATWKEVAQIGSGCDLVPIPQSEVTVAGAYWPGQKFATALQKQKVGAAVNPCVQRITPVAKSSRAKSKGERTTVEEHMKSMKVVSVPKKPVLLIDDTLTLGSTGMAVHQLLRAAGHTKPIALLAACYTRREAEEAKPHVKFIVDWFPGNSYADKVRVR